MQTTSSLALAAFLGLPQAALAAPAAPPAAPAAAVAAATADAAPAPSSPVPPELRLPRTARPLAYALDLEVVPDDEHFKGMVDIDVEVLEAAPLLWLNATELTVASASYESAGKPWQAGLVPGGEDFVGLSFAPPLPPGKGRLHLEFRGRIHDNDTHGLFRQKEGGDWYAYTQFESIFARRAFPCFDEPGYKTPWRLTLHVPKDHVAISNSPIASEAEEPGGRKKVTFAETRPLPSYLVAMAVGPFDSVDLGRHGMKSTPIRVYTPRGRGGEARYAAQTTPELLVQLERYFGTPYPFEKLDQVSIPQTVGFGAMENAGMITYSQSGLLSKPEQLSVAQRRRLASTITHELAHQWFGDLVTMAWCNDIWLNEAFATWMASRIVSEWKPEWDGDVSRVRSRSLAMTGDALQSARKIRQPIESRHDILNAFDGITYSKGAAVLAMFESWMGRESFRKGVQRYLAAHAWGNATAEDFLAALAAEGGPEVGPAFQSFLEQSGTPLVSIALECPAGETPRLGLTQKRFLPLGSKGSDDRTWQIPVCVRYPTAGGAERACTLLKERTGTLTLKGSECPAWVLGNDAGRGYYRVPYSGAGLKRLLADGGKQLSLAERVSVMADLQALVKAGEVTMAEALALVPAYAGDPNRHIAASLADIVKGIRSHLVAPELRPSYVRFIQQMFGERARGLGFSGKAEEDEDVKLLRASLVPLLADAGEDRRLRAEARELALAWLKDRKSIEPDMVGSVLAIAAIEGDKSLFDAFAAEVRRTSEVRERRWLFTALGSFRDPARLKEALGLVLADGLDVRQSSRILWTAIEEDASREPAYAWAKENYEAYVAKIPSESVGALPTLGSGFCDEAHRADLQAFFEPRVAALPGAPRNLARALETIGLCAASKAAQQKSVNEFLKAY